MLISAARCDRVSAQAVTLNPPAADAAASGLFLRSGVTMKTPKISLVSNVCSHVELGLHYTTQNAVLLKDWGLILPSEQIFFAML